MTEREDVFDYIARKYKFPKLLSSLKEAKRKTIENYWQGQYSDRLYVFFSDNTMLGISSQTDYDRCPDCPEISNELDYEAVLSIRAYQAFINGLRSRDREYEYDIWEDQAVKEMNRLCESVRQKDIERREKAQYLRLKKKFEGQKK